MVLLDFLFAFIIAILLSLLIVGVVGWRRHYQPALWPSFLFLFLLLLLLTWVGGIWITPFGPVLLGGYWLPFFFVGLFFAILILALLPPGQIERPSTDYEPPTTAKRPAAIFLWLLTIILITALLLHYL